ncbi:MAG: division/cell wall cluster transcriptional repressor MraZ [Planctomycetaceae bacterium]|nr:division/cell wall cluster transcriptional repressor MraZ [Planctomycetaceae bacterium]
MVETKKLITGEFSRTLDDRYRLSLPDEFKDVFKPEAGKCVIVKENPGHLSLWDETTWKQHHDTRVEMVLQRLNAGYLGQNMPDIQRFGRLLSTRHRHIQLADKARFLLPEGFRDFLAVEPKQEVMLIGASFCIEIWHPKKWISYIEGDMPQFGDLLESLLNNKVN